MDTNNKINELFAKGIELKNQHKFKLAISEFTNCTILNPSNPKFLMYRSLCNLSLEEFEMALIDASKAIEISKSPRDKALSHKTRAQIYQVKGEISNAIAELDISCEYHPTDAFFTRGNIYFSVLNDYKKAFADFNQMHVFEPQKHSHINFMAICSFKLGEFDKAKKLLEQSINMGSENAKELLSQMTFL